MKIGIIGMPLSGKTTLFNLFTGQNKEVSTFPSKGTKNIGVATVYDQRVDFLTSLFQPKKTTYATIELMDISGISPELPAKEKAEIFNLIQGVDALLFTIRLFEDPIIIGEKDPVVQLENLRYELLLRDLEVVENRLSGLKSSKRELTHDESIEKEILEKCDQYLSDGKFLSHFEFTEDEIKRISSFSFYTLKPIIIGLNLDEEQFTSQEFSRQEELSQLIENNNMGSIKVCGKMEMEINQLEPEEKKLFFEDLGIKEPAIERLGKIYYEHLGLISFFTVVKDEVRAWTIKKGTQAVKAAGKVHSDIERGFIRAEIVKYQDLFSLGSVQAVKERGLLKIEGKDALIEDGDIVYFRFNI